MKSTSTKIYYVIQHGNGGTGSYSGETRFGCSLQSAKKFDTVPALLSHVHYLDWKTGHSTWLGLSSHIVRVEETPGVERRVVLGETEAAPAGSTVKYAVGCEGNKELVAAKREVTRNWTFSADDAALASTHAGAMELWDVVRAQGYAFVRPRIVRIALVPGTPTITETVLA